MNWYFIKDVVVYTTSRHFATFQTHLFRFSYFHSLTNKNMLVQHMPVKWSQRVYCSEYSQCMFGAVGEINCRTPSLFSPVIMLWKGNVDCSGYLLLYLCIGTMSRSVICQSHVSWSCSLVKRRSVPGVIKFLC